MAPIGEYRPLIEQELESIVDGMDEADLREQAEHTLLAGGKRIRPSVTVLAAEAVGHDHQAVLGNAVAVELVHNASLLVDDIIDRSTLRRGVESGWAAHGHGAALATSDGLTGAAFGQLTSPEATRVLAEAIVELSQGESMELTTTPTGWKSYRRLAKYKTGALFRAAAQLGAIAAGVDDTTRGAIGEYGERVGIAFQIKDDILDVTAGTDALGKPTDMDAAVDRPSILRSTTLSPERARERALAEVTKAVGALDRAETTDQAATQKLADIAEFAVTREQ